MLCCSERSSARPLAVSELWWPAAPSGSPPGTSKSFRKRRRRKPLDVLRHVSPTTVPQYAVFKAACGLLSKVRIHKGRNGLVESHSCQSGLFSANSSVKRSGVHNQLLRVRLHTITISGLFHVRTELRPLLIIPSLAPHPVQTNREPARHGDLGDLATAPQQQSGFRRQFLRSMSEMAVFHQLSSATHENRKRNP
jgi:hypothetical protein